MPTAAAGSQLGPYQLISPLGAGGMGDVWKARDTRLNRTVAINTSFIGCRVLAAPLLPLFLAMS